MRPAIIAAACLLVGLSAGACSAPTQPAAGEPSTGQGAVAVGTAAARDGTTRPGRMLRAVLRLTAAGIEVVSLTEAGNTVNRRDPLRRSTTFWRSFDSQGNLLEERGFRLETELRSEGPGPDGELTGERVTLDQPVFDVAVPLRPGLRTVRFFRAAPGGDREQADVIGELEVPGDMVR
jgi:hypothetical protein